jgi:2-keto-4-pentenoate hydratase
VRADVVAAISRIAPAIEVACLGHMDGIDVPQMVADNVAQWAYVVGERQVPDVGGLDFSQLELTLRRNGELVQSGRLADMIDDQIDSLVWLANALADRGLVLEAGRCVMTGSCTRPQPSQMGDHWEATFSGLGSVAVAFV